MKSYKDLEDRIRKTGAEIYATIKGEVPHVFDRKRWMGEVMEWAMKDDNFKVQLLRFVDVLPSLRSDALVVKLLKEYFAEEALTPLVMKWGIKGLSDKGILPKIIGGMIRANIESLARQFIAGRDPENTLEVLHTLRRDGFAFTIDLLGEVVVSDREAGQFTERYLKLLEFLHSEVSKWEDFPLLDRDNKGLIPRLDISLKVSSFYSQLDPLDWNGSIERTKNGLRSIFKKAEELGVSITFDMEHYYYKDLTIATFKSILEEFKEFTFAGIALQAYLKDAKEDMLQLIEWSRKRGNPVTVRLVKGAYWDYEIAVNLQRGWPVPIFLNKEETDLNYEELTKILLENTNYVRPAFATHNVRSISHALAVADSLNVPRDAFEFQMLYGMAEPVRNSLQKMPCRIRIYTTVGELIPGMAYLVRRLLENTSNESFLRKSFVENKPFEELIRAPDPGKETEGEKPEEYTFQNEAPSDFSKSINRQKMKSALERVKKEFGKEYPLYIGDSEIISDRHILSINPACPDDVLGKVSSAGIEEAEKAVKEAKKAWNMWEKTSSQERAQYLFRTADEMRKKRFDLAAIEVYEVGKTWKEADADVMEAIDFLEYYGREMVRLRSPQRLGHYPGEYNEYLYESRGVGVVISPWNFPLAIPAGMISAGVVTGNCVIFKPSGLSPVTGWRLIDAFRLSGLPPGVLQFLPGAGGEVGEYLVSHPATDFIAFTGSRDVGLKIIRHAGKVREGQRNVKKVIAEMGGKNAIIIDETADLDESVKGVLESALGYQGQKCSACSRVIVVGDMIDMFCRRLKEAMESIRIGAPEDPSSFMGPLIDKDAFNKVSRYIEIGKSEGEVLLLRETRGQGYFTGPVLFTNVAPGSGVVQDEIFGPVLVVLKAKNIDEAIEIANNTLYALTGGLFSRSPANIRKVREELRVGNLYINRKITGALVGRQPFGGFGMSGVGSKAGGPDYLLQFLNPKSICENTLRKGFAPSDH
jgi:RHH-type proline utilization regulon transcriptional repressor/proline dehydrogenase/delta 1-pyrroline-5-carboxylate dehydrogenase